MTDIQLYASILDGSFDAGCLVDAKGSIAHANDVAKELFDVEEKEEEEESLVGKSMDAIISFWTHSLPRTEQDKCKEDTLNWDSVLQYASRPKDPIRGWTISGKMMSSSSPPQPSSSLDASSKSTSTNQTRRSFPGTLKLSPLKDGYWLVWLRHVDHHEMASNLLYYYDHQDTNSHSQSGTSRREQQQQQRMRRSYFHRSPSIRGGQQQMPEEDRQQQHSSPLVTIDTTGKIVEFNQMALQGTIWNEELVGKHISDIDWTAAASDIAAEQSPRLGIVLERLEQQQQQQQQQHGESDLQVDEVEKQQPSVSFEIGNNDNGPLTTGGIQRDENITEAVFEAALNPLFQIDQHGIIQMVNSAATNIFGWTRDEFLGSNISMICGDDHGPQHNTYLERYLATGETRVIGKNRELKAKRKDGSEFPIEMGVVEVDTFAGDVRLFCGFVRDLSAIKQREKLTEEIVEAALDPMFQINQSGKILMVNQAALTCFGYDREELVGNNVSLICGGRHGRHHDLYLDKYLRTGETHIIGKYRELPARRKDGSEFPIQLAVVELKSRQNEERMFIGFMHDLSNRKRNDDIIRGTIDTSLDPVFHIDVKGIIQRVNRAALDHLGWTRSELLGQNVSMVVGGGHAEHHDEYIRRYLETGEAKAMGRRRKLLARRQDGSEMPIELKLSEINIDGGRERMFCAFLTDLSQREEPA